MKFSLELDSRLLIGLYVRSKRLPMRTPIVVSRSAVERTLSRHHREKAASRFPASAVARFASTSLPRPGGARQYMCAPLLDGTVLGVGPEIPKADHPPWDVDRAPASSLPAPRTPPSAAAKPLLTACYAWLSERCASSLDATSLSASNLA